MAFQLSPGVNVSEIDLTTVVPAVATTDGAIAGVFRWGPIGQRVLVDSETKLATRFGSPSNYNAETWFTAASFLSYANRLWVSRGANTTGATPVVSVTSNTGDPVVTASNTSGISVGMYVFQSANTTAFTGSNTLVVTAVNSSSISLSSNAGASGTFNLYFANPGTTYTSVGLTSNGVVANLVNQVVKNSNDYDIKQGTFDTDIRYVAKYPGLLGNSLRVSVCDNPNSYTTTVNATAAVTFNIGSNTISATVANVATATAIIANFAAGDQVEAGNSSIGLQYLTVTGLNSSGNTSNGSFTISFEDTYRLREAYTTTNITRYWEFFNVVQKAPGQSTWQANYGNTSALDEVHVVVVDNGGRFSGTPGTVLEVYKGLSRAMDAKNADGSTNHYVDVVNQTSNYVWHANDRSTAPSNSAIRLVSSTATAPGNYQFKFGSAGWDEANTNIFSAVAGAYDLFASTEDIDISLVMQGRPLGGSTVVNNETVTGYQLANYIIDNIVEVRKDCIALISPEKSKVLNNFGNEVTSLKNWRNAIHSSSYAVMDTGYKYIYDRYNDIYRWVPMNGDVAGLCVKTDSTNDAWWSPAGFNRGQIKNVVKLAYNPKTTDRDILYSNNINPVVSFQGQGTVLYGDKTLTAKPSSFDHINVRRLFIVLEKAISTASKYSLFEFNDAFTRAQFKNLVNPYLRNIKGRRGITDFLVVCDETNNTPAVIDANQFVGDIYIKPAKSINYIQLNFVAVGTGVQFSEVVGKF